MSSQAENSAPLAVWAESLYLLNLLIIPGLGFAALLWLWWRRRAEASPVEWLHLYQTVMVSFWGGLLIVTVVPLLWWLSGGDSPWTWLWVLLYFTLVHSTLILLGVLGLVKALNGQAFHYPLLGRRAGRLVAERAEP